MASTPRCSRDAAADDARGAACDRRALRPAAGRAPAALAALLLAACGAPASTLRIDAAHLKRDGEPALEVDLDLALGPRLAEALDRGIPITLRFRLESGDRRVERHLRLRYLPLADQYQLYDVERGEGRTVARRAQLVAALDRVRLPLDPEWARAPEPLALAVALDRSALPAALRLPVLVSPGWQLAGAEIAWTSAR
jgi:hypothetical protein